MELGGPKKEDGGYEDVESGRGMLVRRRRLVDAVLVLQLRPRRPKVA